jgi:outer membrane lipoprotein-sorting protein
MSRIAGYDATMKRLPIVLTALLLLVTSSAAFAQTADEVIEKTIAALGGRAALAKVTSRTMTGTITLTTPGGDISGGIDIYNKVPNKSRSVIKLDLSQFGGGPVEIDQRFDGAAGYVIDPLQGNREITGSQLENQKNGAFPSPLLDYKARGITATLLPKQMVAGKEAFVLQTAPKTGSPVKTYIDAETYMILRSVVTVNLPQAGGDVENTVDLSDYRTVDGLKLPFVNRLSSPVQNYTIKIEKVEHNKELDDKMFSKP